MKPGHCAYEAITLNLRFHSEKSHCCCPTSSVSYLDYVIIFQLFFLSLILLHSIHAENIFSASPTSWLLVVVGLCPLVLYTLETKSPKPNVNGLEGRAADVTR